MECLLIIDLLFIYARELLLPLWQIYAGSFLLIVLHISWGLFPFCAIFSNTRTERYGDCFIFIIITIIWIVNYSYCYIGWLDLHIMYPNDSPQILWSILLNELQLVETVALILKRIAACSSCSSEMLDELCKHGVIHQSAHLLASHSRMTLSQPTYTVGNFVNVCEFCGFVQPF